MRDDHIRRNPINIQEMIAPPHGRRILFMFLFLMLHMLKEEWLEAILMVLLVALLFFICKSHNFMWNSLINKYFYATWYQFAVQHTYLRNMVWDIINLFDIIPSLVWIKSLNGNCCTWRKISFHISNGCFGFCEIRTFFYVSAELSSEDFLHFSELILR